MQERYEKDHLAKEIESLKKEEKAIASEKKALYWDTFDSEGSSFRSKSRMRYDFIVNDLKNIQEKIILLTTIKLILEQEADKLILEQEADTLILEQEADTLILEQEADTLILEQEADTLILEQEAELSPETSKLLLTIQEIDKKLIKIEQLQGQRKGLINDCVALQERLEAMRGKTDCEDAFVAMRDSLHMKQKSVDSLSRGIEYRFEDCHELIAPFMPPPAPVASKTELQISAQSVEQSVEPEKDVEVKGKSKKSVSFDPKVIEYESPDFNNMEPEELEESPESVKSPENSSFLLELLIAFWEFILSWGKTGVEGHTEDSQFRP